MLGCSCFMRYILFCLPDGELVCLHDNSAILVSVTATFRNVGIFLENISSAEKFSVGPVGRLCKSSASLYLKPVIRPRGGRGLWRDGTWLWGLTHCISMC